MYLDDISVVSNCFEPVGNGGRSQGTTRRLMLSRITESDVPEGVERFAMIRVGFVAVGTEVGCEELGGLRDVLLSVSLVCMSAMGTETSCS